MKYPLARPFITHSVGRFRCYLPRRNNEVFKYWLWLFFSLFHLGSRLNLDAVFALSLFRWSWQFSCNYLSVEIVLWQHHHKGKERGEFFVCVFHPHPVLWNSYFRVGVCTWEKLTNLTHSTRTRCHTPMTLKGIHFYICSLNAVLINWSMFGRLGRGMRSARGRRWRGRGKVAQQGGFLPQWAWRDSKIHSKRPHACAHPMLSLSAVVNKWEHVSWEKIRQLDHKEGWECGGEGVTGFQ